MTLTRAGESRAFDIGAFASLEGQPIFLEPRGTRHYADRTTVDIRAERGFALRDSRVVVTADVFNLLGEDAATAVKTTVDDRFIFTPNERYGAVRLRVPPRTMRLGMRVELPAAR